MKIAKDTAVTLRYRLTDPQTGRQLDADTIAYLHGGYGNLFPKAEAALEGLESGASVAVDLAVEDAFGPRDESLVRTIAKSDFPPGVKVGGQLRGTDDQGNPQQVYNVVKINGQQVLLDGNHALAGRALRFAAKVEEVRAATGEEISHRHIHGAHGHRH
ncbi:FKBP-type peptidyl-prolyl cis-trans isomerase [Xylophilus sp.]|uniref:FKBP-type peptidyl-prolyl cis-trans isomerase n=1 Tax=Xylophilus sp. TaxID=2653893 RepID=UPI002D7E4BFE|nr:peptidylprolyl isomerase [Xylophilus sp.]